MIPLSIIEVIFKVTVCDILNVEYSCWRDCDIQWSWYSYGEYTVLIHIADRLCMYQKIVPLCVLPPLKAPDPD